MRRLDAGGGQSPVIDFFQTLNIRRFVFSDGDNVNNPKTFIDFLKTKAYLDLETQIICFLGANQNQNTWYNTAIKYIQSLQKSSSFNVTPIRIRTEASNALDMVLAAYVGLSMVQNSSSEFIIVSSDKGYDSVVEHFSSLGISIRRESIRPEKKAVPGKNAAKETETDERQNRIEEVLLKLEAQNKNKLPKKISSLKNFLLASFRDTVDNATIDGFTKELLAVLKRKNKIAVDDQKILWK